MCGDADFLTEVFRGDGRRGEGDDLIPGLLPGVGDGLHGGGLASACRPDTDRNEGAAPDEMFGEFTLPGVEGASVLAFRSGGDDLVERGLRSDVRDRGLCGLEQRTFCGQNAVRGVQGGAGAGQDELAVAAAQRCRSFGQLGERHVYRCCENTVDHGGGGGAAGGVVGERDGGEVRIDGGVDVGDRPVRSFVFEAFEYALDLLVEGVEGAHVLADLAHAGGVVSLDLLPPLGEGVDVAWGAEDLRGPGEPGVLHLTQRLRFLLAGAGVEVGLLVERVHRLGGRHPAVFGAVLGDELVSARFDLAAA